MIRLLLLLLLLLLLVAKRADTLVGKLGLLGDMHEAACKALADLARP